MTTHPHPDAPDVIRSAYAQLAVTDLGAARWFWVDMLGFYVQYEDSGSLYLRGTDELTHHSLVLRKGEVAALDHISYRVRTPEDVDKAEKFFRRLGRPVKRLRKGEGTHGVGDAVRVIDPLGFPVEFFHEIERAERLIQRYDIRHGAEIARLDHFNICTPDIPAAYAHYKSLGFGCSETIEGDEHELYAAWMYRKQTVHDVAFTGGAGPRLHHLGVATHESHQVLRAADIFGALHKEHHIERGPGRHGVSNAFYLYLRDPDGHRVEIYTSDYYTGDPDHETYRWNVKDDRRRDFWGNAVIESWYKEATPVLDLDGRPQPVSDALLDESAVQVGADGLG
ncbi:3,4-dihydroxyphenylacetate 2,3-dioxygenase [Streptomyces diastatochromogenes]|uniref:3,4-dihydroxyphenylacetate 2,3-dioxygenase n=1 Tax=Streptomyces diastatochromogenes TaxID=42236 RepID=A0A233RSL2_STRDA|nr:3,4-dihydroxyphenylacetate 2,3-dioxygenase [Streptomyces diastatochromogenes]MCZ0984747.1 3,4-dihydroxyphenylacetate 2,3-dioxygenase [Streptomyces diastatochromogenes]OXY86377.1 3,4-dihydroxyphenylacetate 2,3-dioxygenase [Streptomyces diastatochromogenes]